MTIKVDGMIDEQIKKVVQSEAMAKADALMQQYGITLEEQAVAASIAVLIGKIVSSTTNDAVVIPGFSGDRLMRAVAIIIQQGCEFAEEKKRKTK